MDDPVKEAADNVFGTAILRAEVRALQRLLEELASQVGVDAIAGVPVSQRYAHLRKLFLEDILTRIENDNPKLAAYIQQRIAEAESTETG